MKPRALYKCSPEDFRVEEIPLYAPSGAGEHLYVTFEKRGLTTDEAVRLLSRAAGVQARNVGVAGMKDKHAVTTQTVSIPIAPPAKGGDPSPRIEAAAENGALAGIELLAMAKHGNKLKTGHLTGNRFDLIVRGVRHEDVQMIIDGFLAMRETGVPNAYGVQRFGFQGGNAERARAWLTGKAQGPRDVKQKRFLWSALQSALFNTVLDARVADGTWRTPLLGDICRLHGSGGLFRCDDPAVDGARAAAGEICPTGPMIGLKVTGPTGAPGDLEERLAREVLGADFDLETTRGYGDGARRALVLPIEEMTAELSAEPVANATHLQNNTSDGKKAADAEQLAALRVRFVLPRGAYATTVLSAVLDISEPSFATRAAPAGLEATEAEGAEGSEETEGAGES